MGGGSSGADAGLVQKVGAGAGGSEAAVLPSIPDCWGLWAGAPLFVRARFGGSGGAGAGGAWGWKKECVDCSPGSRSGGSAGVCMVAFTWFRVRSSISLGFVHWCLVFLYSTQLALVLKPMAIDQFIMITKYLFGESPLRKNSCDKEISKILLRHLAITRYSCDVS